MVCLLIFSLAHHLGDQGAAACTEHKAEGTYDHQEGHNEVYSGKGRFSHKVGDEKPVYHTVDRGKDHHQDRRHCKAKQSLVSKMIRKLNGMLHIDSKNKVIKYIEKDSDLIRSESFLWSE